MNIYDENYNSIQKRHEHISRFINKFYCENKKSLLNNVQSINTKDGNKALIVENKVKRFRLNSSFQPIEEAKRWTEQFDFNKRGITVSVFGFGNGLMVRELLNRLNANEKIIIYEPSQDIFLHVINNYNIADILNDSRVYLIIEGINQDEFSKILSKNINWTNIYSQVICTLPKYDEIFPDNYKVFNKIINGNNDRAIIRKNTQSHFAEYFVTNTIYNIKLIKDSITTEDLKKILNKEVPAIIVSAGPSLDNNIEELRRAKGKAVIISVDTSIKYLIEKDIVPDIIITVDSNNPPGYLDYEQVENIPMIIRTESNYRITYKHKGRIIFFEGHEYINYLYKESGKKLPRMSSGGSVSTAAFAVCAAIGFKKIILVGQDLAYLNGHTHAGGTVEVSANNTDDMFVEDIYGNMIKTRYDWYCYLTWLNSAVTEYVSGGNEVIDATEGGAKIKGTKIMALSKVIDLYCQNEINVNELINSIKPTFIDDEINIIKECVINTINELDIIKRKSNDSIENCNRLIEEYKNKSSQSYMIESLKNNILKNNKIIGELSANLLLDTYIASVATKQLSDVYKENEKEDRKVDAYIEIYKANIKGAEAIGIMLKDLLISM